MGGAIFQEFHAYLPPPSVSLSKRKHTELIPPRVWMGLDKAGANGAPWNFSAHARHLGRGLSQSQSGLECVPRGVSEATARNCLIL